jgi:rubrerythrin
MVVEFLSDIEALKVAMNLEEEGLKFYREMGDKTKKLTVKATFSRLAKDEVEHFNTFEKLHRELSGKLSPTGWVLDEELRSYLGSVIETGVFYDASYLPKATIKTLSERDAFLIGAQAEKDSILFFTEASQKSTNPSSRKAFLWILEEEKKHLAILNEEIQKLAKK